MSTEEVAENLVIEDDEVQHFIRDGDLHVYHPEAGVFRITPTPGGSWKRGGETMGPSEYSIAFHPGPPVGGFFSLIAIGATTLPEALRRAMEGSTCGDVVFKSPEWHDEFAKRLELWLGDLSQ